MNKQPANRAPLVLWGASGHGKVILDAAHAMNVFGEIIFIDDGHNGSARQFCNLEVLSPEQYFQTSRGHSRFIVSVGDNLARATCFQKALDHGLIPATIIHPTAIIANSAHIGPGTVVMPRVVVNSDAQVGRNCILNTAAVIEHDCRIGDHVHISPGVLLAGGVIVGSMTHVGIGAIAIPQIEIGESSIVGAGAVVVRSIPSHVTAVGIPARPREAVHKNFTH